MSKAAIDLIGAAFRKLSAYAAGETLSAEDAATGLEALNDVIDTWNAEGLTLFNSMPTAFNTVVGTNTYTMGAGGTWGTTRPTSIGSAYCTVSGVDFPIEQWTIEEWEYVPIKTVQQQIIERFVYVNDYPQAKVILWPTPLQIIPVTLNFNQPLTSVANTATVLDMPPAYIRALQYAVAVELQPEFGGNDVSAMAKATKAVLMKSNRTPKLAGYDSALTGGGRFIPVRGY